MRTREDIEKEIEEYYGNKELYNKLLLQERKGQDEVDALIELGRVIREFEEDDREIKCEAELLGFQEGRTQTLEKVKEIIKEELKSLSQLVIGNINNIMYKWSLGDFGKAKDWCENNKEYLYVSYNGKIDILNKILSKLEDDEVKKDE